jgi:hypothetical protein
MKMTMMRLTILIGNKYYYDIGLRGSDTKTSKTTRSFGEDHPRYLEDFIELCGKRKVKIISYGKLADQRKKIDKMLI